MDRRFLTEIIDAYLVDHKVYSNYQKKDIDLIRKTITNEVISLTKDLRENDIELYDKLWDKSKVTQQQIITDYLNMNYADDETINEIAGTISFAIGTVLGLIAIYSGMTKTISKFTMKTIESIGKKMEKIGLFLTKRGRYWKFRYAIIQRNARQCYIKCGVTPEDVDLLHYMNVGSGSSIHTEKSKSQAQCLQNCFINYSIEAIALQLHYYFVCVKKQGDFYEADKLKQEDILKVVSGVPLSAACKDFFNEVQESFSVFYDLLDFIYGSNERSKQSALMKLKDRVIQTRNEISREKNMNKFK